MTGKAAKLRNGYTTGSAAAAAAVAAFTRSSAPVALILPKGKTLDIPVARLWENGAAVIKDGGDDPDVTTGCEICVELMPFDGEADSSDYIEYSGDLELIIRAGKGVGRVTRPGLAVPVGKSAINPVPRRMLAENLSAVGCCGRQLLTISVPGGVAVAEKTMNPTLGIVGGISILGQTGIVRPYSNAAYAATITLQLRSCVASGMDTAAVVTGSRSAEAVKRDFLFLAEEAVIPIADFIHVAVVSAKKAGLNRLIVGCMPGKLFKYACGEKNTHAHKSKMNLLKLREWGLELPGIGLEKMDTMGELAEAVDAETFRRILELTYTKANECLQQWGGKTAIELVLYDNSGKREI